MYYRSIGSGLGIGRYSKSNDSDSDSRAKKPDRDIPKKKCMDDKSCMISRTSYHEVLICLLFLLSVILDRPRRYPLAFKHGK